MMKMEMMVMMVMMVTKRSDAAEVLAARSGEAVLLKSDLQEAELEHIQDIRWTHLHLLLKLKRNMTTCHHGRCQLLSDGSLRFTRVQTEDSGTYRMQVFDGHGNRLKTKDFLLRVDGNNTSPVASGGGQVVVPALMLFVVLLLLVFIFILMRRRRRRSQQISSGRQQDSVYVEMHSHHGNKKEEEGPQEREESLYVPCTPAVSMETPITDDVYV